MLAYRNQWSAFTDYPKTMILSAHGWIANKKIGIGGAIFNDKTGPTSRSGAMASYAYHLPLENAKLAFGLSAMFFQYALDKGKLTTDEPDDAAIQGETVKKIVPEGAFGVYYYGEKYYAGFSVPQLIQMKVDVGGSPTLNRMVRHYFLTGGYKFDINDDFAVEPSFLLKAVVAAPLQVDINSKVIYKDLVWLGFSYRTRSEERRVGEEGRSRWSPYH